MDFFIDIKIKKGADFPIVSSSFLGHGQATFTTDKYADKVHALHRTRNSSLTCSRRLKIGRIQEGENKS